MVPDDARAPKRRRKSAEAKPKPAVKKKPEGVAKKSRATPAAPATNKLKNMRKSYYNRLKRERNEMRERATFLDRTILELRHELDLRGDKMSSSIAKRIALCITKLQQGNKVIAEKAMEFSEAVSADRAYRAFLFEEAQVQFVHVPLPDVNNELLNSCVTL